jgi:hypothetical protein
VAQVVEQADRVLASVAGEMAVVAIDRSGKVARAGMWAWTLTTHLL